MRRFSLPHVAAVLAVCLGASGSSAFGADFSTLSRRVPESANALILVDADRVFGSAAAKSEKWAADREARFKAGLTSMPPNANQMIIASQFDYEYMHPIWKFALVQSEKPTLLATVAREFGGVLDRVTGFPAVRLPDDSFIVELSEKVRAGMAPANRQQTSRWVGSANHKLSPYLTEATGYADKAAHVIMAFDTTGAFSADDVAHRMGSNMDIYQKILMVSPVEPKELADMLASMKGITLGITFTDQAFGSIKVDFGADITKLEPIARPLLLAVLAHRGAMIEDFNDWKSEVKGTKLILHGKLGSSGVMRLSSLIQLPSNTMASQIAQGKPADSDNTQNTPKTMAQSTQDYFKRTESLMKNLRAHKGEAHSFGTIGLWFGNYANHIERIPILNVDKEMLDYGTYLAGQLRNCSLAIKGVGIQQRPAEIAASREAGGGSITANTYGYAGWGGYGRYGNFSATGTGAAYVASRMTGSGTGYSMYMAARSGMRKEQQARVEVRSNLRAQGATTVTGIVAEIQTSTAKVRRDMTEKYQIEF